MSTRSRWVWDNAGFASLAAYTGQLGCRVPGLIAVTDAAHQLAVTPDPRLDALPASTPNRPAIVPLVQNLATHPDVIWL